MKARIQGAILKHSRIGGIFIKEKNEPRKQLNSNFSSRLLASSIARTIELVNTSRLLASRIPRTTSNILLLVSLEPRSMKQKVRNYV